MNPKDGNPVTPVEPAEPDPAEDADLADPGKMAEIKAEQIEKQKGKYGSTPVTPFNPPTEEEIEENEEELTWIEIEMVDEEDEPYPSEKYRITLPDDSVTEGTLDGKGFARIEGIEPGTCKVTFPNLDHEAWEKI